MNQSAAPLNGAADFCIEGTAATANVTDGPLFLTRKLSTT
jgi:hypothetical protein